MSNDNRLIRENTVRPVVGIHLNQTSEKAHISIEVINYSNTDAMGLLSIQLHVNDDVHSLDDESYEAKKIWYFPALQVVMGHKEFSGKLKTLKAISNPDVELRLVAYLYYKIWSRDKKEISKGRKYYAPVKRWIFKHRDAKWIGELTSKSHLAPPEPNWEILIQE